MSDKPEADLKVTSTSEMAGKQEVCPQCGSGRFLLGEAADMAAMQKIIDAQKDKAGTQGEGLTKWEQDTFRDIINNVNNTLRFQIQLGVPLLAGCVTALNIVPPQEHQELLNLFDKWVFIPVLLSMGVGYYGLELHWGMTKGKPTDETDSLYRLVKKKYLMVHLAILLQLAGLILLITFVVVEYK